MTSLTDDRTVAVVGAGIKAPGGDTLDELWQRLLTGHAAISPFRHPDLPADISLMVGEASGFDPATYVSAAELRRLNRVQLLAIGAAEDALRDCGDRPPPSRCAVVCGQGYPSSEYLEETYARIATHGLRGLSPMGVPTLMLNSTAAQLAIRYGFEGPCLTVAAA